MSNVPLSNPASEVEQTSRGIGPGRFERWHRRVLAICLVTFALEVGLFLVVYPWTRGWALNFLPARVAGLVDVWMTPSLRAGVSALGLIDLWIAGVEFWRLIQPKH